MAMELPQNLEGQAIIIQHKPFEFGSQLKTVTTIEYSVEWKRGDEPYYPIN